MKYSDGTKRHKINDGIIWKQTLSPIRFNIFQFGAIFNTPFFYSTHVCGAYVKWFAAALK